MSEAPRVPGVRPFSSGSEGADWVSANCDRCTKQGEYDAQGNGPCPMETAVSRGFILGTIPADIAVEFGATLNEQPGYCTMPDQCSQFAPVMTCESIRTRTRRPCGKPAVEVVESGGLKRTLCAHHHRVYLADSPAASTTKSAVSKSS